MIVRKNDFVDPDFWDYLIETAKSQGLLEDKSFDEGEIDEDPDEIELEIQIVKVS